MFKVAYDGSPRHAILIYSQHLGSPPNQVRQPEFSHKIQQSSYPLCRSQLKRRHGFKLFGARSVLDRHSCAKLNQAPCQHYLRAGLLDQCLCTPQNAGNDESAVTQRGPQSRETAKYGSHYSRKIEHPFLNSAPDVCPRIY